MNKKKIIILNPPSPDADYINRDLMGGMGVHNTFGKKFLTKIIRKAKNTSVRLPVLQLVNCATILYKTGLFDIKVIDSLNENIDLQATLSEINKFQPNLIIMAVSSSCLLYERDVVAKKIKDNLNDCLIISVGDMITERPKELLPFFDIGIIGEVERNIVSICNGEPLDKIDAIVYQNTGQIKINHLNSHLEADELEKVSFPKWDLFPYEKYSYYPMLNVKPIVSILSSRGCPYDCGYCPYTKNQGLKWRARSAENVFNELKYDVDKYSVKGFVFRDPLFSLNQKRVEELCNLIIKNQLKIEFVIETRPELLTEGLIDILSKAGCHAINFGVEDIHKDILNQINRKPIDLNHLKRIVNYCEISGIRTSCFFIIGLPGSNGETIKETIEFSRDLFPSQVEYKIATPYPGTKLHDMAKEKGWLKSENYNQFGGYTATMQISDELTQEYLEKVVTEAFNKFYLSPKYIIRAFKRGQLLDFLKLILKKIT